MTRKITEACLIIQLACKHPHTHARSHEITDAAWGAPVVVHAITHTPFPRLHIEGGGWGFNEYENGKTEWFFRHLLSGPGRGCKWSW